MSAKGVVLPGDLMAAAAAAAASSEEGDVVEAVRDKRGSGEGVEVRGLVVGPASAPCFYSHPASAPNAEPPGCLQYLLKWRSFGEASNTWEPIQNCGGCLVPHQPNHPRARNPEWPGEMLSDCRIGSGRRI